MDFDKKYNPSHGLVYRLRIMSCIILVELILLGIFNLWPAPENSRSKYSKVIYNDETVLMPEAVRTRQQSSPPPPPKPRAPVPVPRDEIIEEEIINLENVSISDYSDSLSISRFKGAGDSDNIASSPDQPPSVIRIVEATTPEAAQKANIKVEVTVSFLVNKEGNVEDASIARIKLYKGDTGKYNIVDTIGYGITEATLSAALQWKFRPARNNGDTVRAYSKQIFTFGF